MRKITTFIAVSLLALVPVHAQVTFQFDYSMDTSGYFAGANSYRQYTLEAAGAKVASYLTSQTLSAVSGTYTAAFTNPNSDGTQVAQVSNVSVAANTILIYVGSFDYGSAVIAQAGPAVSFSNDSSTNTLVSSRGTDFEAPVIGSMSFNSLLAFGSIYFDQDVSNYESTPGASASDAYTVIQHELFHVLGIGTNAAWYDLVDADNDVFLGAAGTAANGGVNPALNSGNDHFSQALLSKTESGVVQSALLNPFVFTDNRFEVTDLDLAALVDLGWSAGYASAVPEPSSIAALFGLAALGFAATRRRTRRA